VNGDFNRRNKRKEMHGFGGRCAKRTSDSPKGLVLDLLKDLDELRLGSVFSEPELTAISDDRDNASPIKETHVMRG